MSPKVKCFTLAVAAWLAMLGWSAISLACSVPVFRYALERWPADYYQVVVFHKGELTAEQKKIVDLLGEDGVASKQSSNIYAVTIDVDTLPKDSEDTSKSDDAPAAARTPQKELAALWKQQKEKAKTMPWMVVRYPWQTGIPVPLWAGSLDESIVRNLIQSPLRQEVAKRILGGHTAVWVLLESGDKKKDDAALKLVEEQLRIAEKEIPPPEVDPVDVAMGYMSSDPEQLKIKFSTMRVSRDDPAEKMFAEMLLGSEPDLREFKEPMVFPVFGRARALFALVGEGINQDNIAEALFILTGPCTCTIKAQNPGTDLVVATDWDAELEAQYVRDMELQELPGLGGLAAEETAKTDAPSENPEESNTSEMANGTDQVASVGAVEPLSGTADTAELAESADDRGTDEESGVAEPVPSAVATESSEPAATTTARGLDPMIRNVLVLAVLGVLIVGAGSFWIAGKSGSS